MGKPWSTPQERTRLRNAMAAVLRMCAREGLPVPSYPRWPVVLHAEAGLDVSVRFVWREMHALFEQPPADLRWRIDGRHRRVAVLLEPDRWSDFTPLNCVTRMVEHYARAGGEPLRTGDSDFLDEGLDAHRTAWSSGHHLGRLATVAAQQLKPVATLYR